MSACFDHGYVGFLFRWKKIMPALTVMWLWASCSIVSTYSFENEDYRMVAKIQRDTIYKEHKVSTTVGKLLFLLLFWWWALNKSWLSESMSGVGGQTQRVWLKLSSNRMTQLFHLRKNEKMGRWEGGAHEGAKQKPGECCVGEMGHEESPMVHDCCIGAKYKCMAHADQHQVDTE